jgi:hypothetical protein
VFAHDVGKLVKPPRWSGCHQHNLDARTLDRSQRRPRPLRTRPVAAQQRAVQV